MFKIILVGNSNVGKTALVNRFLGKPFDPNGKATIAADFQTKIMHVNGTQVRLQVWDLVGMDSSFAEINRAFVRHTAGVIFVGDLTNPKSVESCCEWKA